MKLSNYIIILTLILNSCNHKQSKQQPEFYYSKFLEIDNVIIHDDGYQQFNKYEVIIVRNANKYNKNELINFIKQYESKFNTDTIYIQDRYSIFERYYYKESQKTPIDFIEDPGGFITDKLEDHKDDFICERVMHKKILPHGEIIIKWTNECE